MTKWLLGVLVLACLAPLSVPAETVTCESEGGRLKECSMDTRGNVQVIKELSNTRCVEGVNWGLNRNSIWVKDGCRAIFQSGSSYSSSGNLPRRTTCESEVNRSKECAMDTRGKVRLIRQISSTRCVEGVNWRVNRNSIWVDDGCRAEFESTGGSGDSGYNPSGLPMRVTCESEVNKSKECAMDTRGSVRLVRQISGTRCVEGINWKVNRNSVWVNDGCRAEFESTGGSGGSGYSPSGNLPTRAICESEENRSKECAMDTRGSVRLVRQISSTRCVEGVNWRVNRNSVWVNNGCRAEFESTGGFGGGSYSPSGSPTRVTCESEDGRMKECAMNTRGSVRVARQISSTKCVEGVNWGLNRNSIWVKDGCRAEFELVGSGGSGSSSASPPDSAVRACNAVQDRSGEVVSYTPLKPGAWEIILRYSDGQYVCNVDRNGRVSYFEKLRR
jgi:hypothetical protein